MNEGHFIEPSQNPFQVFTEGVVKITEFLQNQQHQHQANFIDQEDMEFQGGEESDVAFSDTFLQLSVVAGEDSYHSNSQILVLQ